MYKIHFPQHWVDDGLLEGFLGLLLPDDVGERDGGAATLDNGRLHVRLKVGAAGG